MRGDTPGCVPKMEEPRAVPPGPPFCLPLVATGGSLCREGDGLRALRPLTPETPSPSSDVTLRCCLGLSGTVLARGVRGVRGTPGSAPGRTGTPLRVVDGLGGGRLRREACGLPGGMERGWGWTACGLKPSAEDGTRRGMWLGCLAGLEERAESGCRMGLGGHSCTEEPTLDLGLDDAGEDEVGVDLGVTLELAVCLSPETTGTGMEEDPRPWVGSLRADDGLAGVSTKAFLWSLGLS